MALYFLEKSPAYRKETSPSVYRRREIVCKHLNENYKAGRHKDEETLQAVSQELAVEHIEMTLGTYRADKVLIRTSYIWLIANEKEKKRILAVNTSTALAGVRCLIQDGIQTWQELMGTELSGAGQTAGPSATEQTPQPPAPEVPKRVRLWECAGGPEVVETLSRLIPQLEMMLTEDETLKQEVGRLSEENQALKSRTADDQSYIELVEGELAQADAKNKDLRESLRHAQTSAHAATLETIAEENPDFPELTRIVQQLKERRTKLEAAPSLAAQLPARYKWQNDSGAVEYREPFLRALSQLPAEEQERVVKQVETLAAQGSGYASLHTRKTPLRIPFSPSDCMMSRGADDLRFTWKKQEALTLFWLFRKGDSRVRSSES